MDTLVRLHLAADLSSGGDAPALILTPSGTTGPRGDAAERAGVLSYRDLEQRVRDTAQRLGRTRSLVLLEATPTADCVITYLAALRGHHPVILADPGRPDLLAELRRRFRPDVRVGAHGWHRDAAGDAAGLHPDLAVLLSTSGSTGSPKLVRLSRDAVQANADTIAGYLRLTQEDRAATSLPLGYSYGLSVLNSHLVAGAATVLTDRSVADPEFWSLMARHRISGFAGVPHTYALLERRAEPWYASPGLRYVTQAGGRLVPAEVSRLAARGARHGWELFVMYGATEATARMAYLPPDLAHSRPDSIGTAIPGSSLRVAEPDTDGVGELVFSGPGVMLGYATSRADLARGAELSELRTGDLGRRDGDGLFTVVGRRSRFAKILGCRIDLDRVQDAVSVLSGETACTSDDQRLTVTVTAGDPALVRGRVAAFTGLPAGLVDVRQVAQLPRLPSGKVDLVALHAVPSDVADRDRTARADRESRLESLAAAYAEVLGYDRVDPDATFAGLGGDSLSFVEMSVRLEEDLGSLPDDWPELSIRTLAALALDQDGARLSGPAAQRPASSRHLPSGRRGHPPDRSRPDRSRPDGYGPDGPGPDVPGPRRSRPAAVSAAAGYGPARRTRGALRLETGVVLRAVAIVLVVAAHLELWTVRGGAHLLLAIAGFTFARFPLAAVRAADSARPLVSAITRIALPAVAFIALLCLVDPRFGWSNVLLLNHLLGPDTWSASWNFWFLESLVTILVVAAALFAIPAVRRFERAHPVLTPALVLAVGLLIRYGAFGLSDVPLRFGRPLLVFWLFALGWLIQRATTVPLRLAVTAVALVSLTGYFPDEPVRGLVVQSGLVLLTWLPSVPVGRPAAVPLRYLAARSLWIYLTHWSIWPVLLAAGLARPLVAVACLIAGIAVGEVVDRAQRAAQRRYRRLVAPATRRTPQQALNLHDPDPHTPNLHDPDPHTPNLNALDPSTPGTLTVNQQPTSGESARSSIPRQPTPA